MRAAASSTCSGTAPPAASTTASISASGAAAIEIDDRVRPNQVLALALPYELLDPARAASVLDVVEARLLTPFGLRSLDPGHADYRPRYGVARRNEIRPITRGRSGRGCSGRSSPLWCGCVATRAAGRRGVSSSVPLLISVRHASARSPRSSTPRRRSHRAGARHRPGELPSGCGRRSKSAETPLRLQSIRAETLGNPRSRWRRSASSHSHSPRRW